MEDQCCPLSWGYYYPEEGIEELKHSLLLELETTLLTTYEEIARKEDELIHLKDLFSKTIKERDEAREKCQILKLEKLILQQQLLQHQQQLDGLTTIRNEDELKVDGGSKNSGKNLTAPPVLDPIPLPPPPPPQVDERLLVKKPLPENGKFLQAVMEAGPLLQTLLLAGPLPQWQHPPPQLKSMEIPPVTIPSPAGRLLHQDNTSSSPNGNCYSKKRALVPCAEASDSSPITKPPKVVHQSHLTNC